MKTEEFALHGERATQLPERDAAEHHAGKSGLRVEILEDKLPEPVLFRRFIERKSNQENPQTKKSQLNLGKDDGTVALEMAHNRIENGNVHVGRLFRFRHGGVNFRR